MSDNSIVFYKTKCTFGHMFLEDITSEWRLKCKFHLTFLLHQIEIPCLILCQLELKAGTDMYCQVDSKCCLDHHLVYFPTVRRNARTPDAFRVGDFGKFRADHVR